ncbi:MAG TPA: PIN domain-containing protein [Vicinamibacterales bacterium]|nr:PIN domain-containing protein [Vicinamibacterales bacterium]
MALELVVLDTDTLSELSRGNTLVKARAAAYLAKFGRLTITAVTVFERLRGYRAAIRVGKPFERQLQAFEALVANCVVLPFDQDAAAVAADIWSASPRNRRSKLGDILIAGVATSRQMPLATRNTRDFQQLTKASGISLRLVDWTLATPRVVRSAGDGA